MKLCVVLSKKVGRPLSRDQNRRSIMAFGICCLTSGYSSSSKNPTFWSSSSSLWRGPKGLVHVFFKCLLPSSSGLGCTHSAMPFGSFSFSIARTKTTKPSRRCLFSFENELFLWVRQRDWAGTLQTLVDVSKDGGVSWKYFWTTTSIVQTQKTQTFLGCWRLLLGRLLQYNCCKNNSWRPC